MGSLPRRRVLVIKGYIILRAKSPQRGRRCDAENNRVDLWLFTKVKDSWLSTY